MASLTWLHLSDLHACKPRSGWDANRVREALVADLSRLQRDHGLRPALIFFTGDAAFGHISGEPGKSIEDQFREAAAFFDDVRKAFTPEVLLQDIFLVPGNHDVDRRKVSQHQTRWLEDQQDLDPIVQLIQEGGYDWQIAMARLSSYLDFLRAQHLNHLLQDKERALWAAVREVDGLRVGIAGFNSAWSCGRDGEKGRVWAAGSWQQGTLREQLRGTDLSIALIHHPPEWLVMHESPDFERRLRQDFRFLLHGHDHKDWVESGDDGFTKIAAGACYDRSDKANGYNLVQLDLKAGRGKVWLRQYDATGGGWVARPIHGQTNEQGVRPLKLKEANGSTASRVRAQRRKSMRNRPSAAAAAGLDPELARYLERLTSAHRDLPIAGFATRVRLPIQLESVYVPLRARILHHVLDSDYQKPGSFRELSHRAAEERDVPFDEVLPLALGQGFRGAIVLGDPGSGKTTLLKHFALAAADPATGPRLLGLAPETVPVFLELRRLRAPAAGLRAAITEALERADPGLDASSFALELLRRDHLLVLADGLDEIADPGQRADVSRWLEEAVGMLPHSTFVVSSRYAGYKGDARFSNRFLELHVRDLAEPEARRFIHDWYCAVETQAELGREPEVAQKLAVEAAEELAGRLFGREDPRTANLQELATNPLMLQILCLVHRDRRHLPDRRVELYGECCQVLLELWRRAKGMSVTLSAMQAFKLLQPLAYWLHTHERKEATAEEILPLLFAPLREIGRDPVEAEALLAAIHDQTGVLVNVGASFMFLHLSFQEYLCARHLQDNVVRAPGLLAGLGKRFGETWWREVILLAVGLDNPSLFEILLGAILGQEALHRDVRLAEDCLSDASAATPRPILQALAQGLKNPEERYHALRLLRSLPTWESEFVTEGLVGRDVVKLLKGDDNPQVQRMANELLGVLTGDAPSPRWGETEAAHDVTMPRLKAPPARGEEPSPGEECFHEMDGTILLYIPGGEYVLGDNVFGPVRRVVLSSFWIAKYPVTNEQYTRFLAEANTEVPEPECWRDRRFNEPQQPVVGVSWDEARAYCRWAGLQLPSAAQWEAAARGKDQRGYPWGNEEPTSDHANFDMREGRTTPVGRFPKGAGPFGTLDQAGNVWEWCADEVPMDTGEVWRALKGGGWGFPAMLLRSAYCRRCPARSRYDAFGFRVAATFSSS